MSGSDSWRFSMSTLRAIERTTERAFRCKIDTMSKRRASTWGGSSVGLTLGFTFLPHGRGQECDTPSHVLVHGHRERPARDRIDHVIHHPPPNTPTQRPLV